MKMNHAFRGVAFALALVLVLGGLTACDEEKSNDNNPSEQTPGAQPVDATPAMLNTGMEMGDDSCGACPVTGKTAGAMAADAKSDDACGACPADAMVPAAATDMEGGCGSSCGDCPESKKKSCDDCSGCEGTKKKIETPQ
jgi:hypothetical protein